MYVAGCGDSFLHARRWNNGAGHAPLGGIQFVQEPRLQEPPLLVWHRPVTRRSGKSWRVVRRRACQARLVYAVYHWSRVAVQHDPISKAKYKALRARGHSHGRALRSIADRLLAIACAMLRDQTSFDHS